VTVHLIREVYSESFCGISVKFLRGPITNIKFDPDVQYGTMHAGYFDCVDCKEEYGLVLLGRL
jgi:hypothetical protein